MPAYILLLLKLTGCSQDQEFVAALEDFDDVALFFILNEEGLDDLAEEFLEKYALGLGLRDKRVSGLVADTYLMVYIQGGQEDNRLLESALEYLTKSNHSGNIDIQKRINELIELQSETAIEDNYAPPSIVQANKLFIQNFLQSYPKLGSRDVTSSVTSLDQTDRSKLYKELSKFGPEILLGFTTHQSEISESDRAWLANLEDFDRVKAVVLYTNVGSRGAVEESLIFKKWD